MRSTEKELLEGIREGRDDVFRKLFDIYYHRLFCIARQYLQDDFASETIVCDLFFHIWETRHSLNITTSLNAYLIRSVRNYSLNYLQKKHIKKEIELHESSAHLFETDEFPLGILLEKELTQVLNDEIKKLPFETQRVFILSRIQELKHNEIAKQLNISTNTVKYHIKQALSILRKNLKDYFITFYLLIVTFF